MLTVVRQYLAAAFLIVIGLMAYGCGDSGTVNPVVELASLEVALTNGSATLRPAFNRTTTSYIVDLSSGVESVTVTARPAVSGDTVKIDGQTTTSRSITLDPPGSTTVVEVVVSETDTNSRTYTIRLVRAGLDGNNSLESLTLSPGTLPPPGFNPNTLNYAVDVENNAGNVTVTPTPSDTAATMTVNGQPAISGQPSIVTLGGPGSNTRVDIVVTAQNNTTKAYTIFVNRGGLSGNNSLQSLTVSPGTLAPTFNANLLSYSVDVANNVGSVSVTPTRQESNATISVNGQPATSGQARTVTLNPAGQPTLVTIIVNAQNGTDKNYLISVSRGVSSNNNLQGLTVSPGTLNFRPDDTSYTVNVGSAVTSVAVTPTRQDSNATITVNGQSAPTGQARTIQLGAPGSNTPIFVLVTAQNGTQKTYTAGVIRTPLGGNNILSGLTVSPGSLTPAFSGATTSYTVNVGSDVGSITVTPREQDTAATTTVNGQVTTSGQARTIPLNGAGSTTFINIAVTAPNSSQKTYSVNVIRAPLGGNNNLSALTVSPGPLDSPFNANDLNYTVNVGSDVDSITVTPREQDTAATTTVNGQATTSGQARAITLNGAGSNTLINIAVTAPNGTPKTYSVNVIRAALGGNNNLSGLTVSPGALSPAFGASRTSYRVNVGSDVNSITVIATKADPSASMTINGQGTSSGQARAISPLNPAGETEIETIVIAPNGNDKIYLITVNQPAPAEPPAPTVAPDLIPEDDSCLSPNPPDPLDPNKCEPGTSREDNFTNKTTPRFRIPQPGSVLTPNLYVDGIKVESLFDPANNTLQPTAPLSGDNDGVQHSITSTVTNTATNLESDQSDALIVTISTGQSGV